MRFAHPFFRAAVIALWVVTAASCSEPKPAEPEIPSTVRAELIKTARLIVGQREDWGDRVEFKIHKQGDQWRVTAWRVVYPEAKGNARYVPWGARTMVIDRNFRVLEYRSGAK